MYKNGNSSLTYFHINYIFILNVNLLNGSDNEYSTFATRKSYIINEQNNGQYGGGNENDSTIKLETEVIKPNLWDHSDAYILVT